MRMRIRSKQRGWQAGRGTRAVDGRVTPLLEAHRLGEDLSAAAIEIAAQYARDGESLDTLLHDVGACLAIVGLPSPESDTLRRLSIAWAGEYSGRYDRITCVHEGSGPHSLHQLQSHVRTLLLGEQPPAPRGYLGRSTAYALLVAELPAELVTPAHIAMVGEELAEKSPPGTVIASLTSKRSVSLLRRTPATSELAGQIERSLTARLGIAHDDPRPRVWVEGLPDRVDVASQLVAELAR